MEDIKLQLPFTRVKRVCKLDPALNSISADAVKLLTLATEKYIAMLARCAARWALANSRKTVHLGDIEQCVQRDWLFSILEDALADWPDEDVQEKENEEEVEQVNEGEMKD